MPSAGAVMKSGELRLVLIDSRPRLLDCGSGGSESWLDPLPEHPARHPVLTRTQLAINRCRIATIFRLA